MDYARGAAILLVIVSHSITLLRFGFEVPPVLTKVSNALSPFRMPLLAFLSGLLAHLSLRKRGVAFFWGKTANLLWPYMLWTGLSAFTIGAQYSFSDHELYISYLWYLFYLFFFYAAAYLFRNFPLLPLIMVALTIATVIPGDIDAPRRFFYLMATFFLGQLAHQHSDSWVQLITNKWKWALLVPVAIGSLMAVTGERVRYAPEWLAASISGVVVICALAYALTRFESGFMQSILSLLAGMGRQSIVYYVSHFPVIYGTVILCASLGISTWLAFPISIFAALLSGVTLVFLRKKFAVANALFTFPTRSSIKRAETSPPIRDMSIR